MFNIDVVVTDSQELLLPTNTIHLTFSFHIFNNSIGMPPPSPPPFVIVASICGIIPKFLFTKLHEFDILKSKIESSIETISLKAINYLMYMVLINENLREK